MVETEFKKTKNNPALYGGTFGRIKFTIFKNTNKNNVQYFEVSFWKIVGAARIKSIPVGAGELANMQMAIDSARNWLRKTK